MFSNTIEHNLFIKQFEPCFHLNRRLLSLTRTNTTIVLNKSDQIY